MKLANEIWEGSLIDSLGLDGFEDLVISAKYKLIKRINPWGVMDYDNDITFTIKRNKLSDLAINYVMRHSPLLLCEDRRKELKVNRVDEKGIVREELIFKDCTMISVVTESDKYRIDYKYSGLCQQTNLE